MIVMSMFGITGFYMKKNTKSVLGLALLFGAGAMTSAVAQTVESIPFRMNMSPANEVPAINDPAISGFGTVWVRVVRDAAGKVVSGTVDFGVRYQLAGPITITGLHIHKGDAGTNGPVLIDSRINGANPVVDEMGRGAIDRPVEVPAGSPNVAVIEDLLKTPSAYYINMHTTVNPGGVIRAQLTRAERRVYGVLMTPGNELPAVQNSQARGIGFLTVLNAFGDRDQLISSEVTFDLDYTGFAEGTQFTGMHIHSGRANVNGPVTIGTSLSGAQNVIAGAGGSGKLRYVVDANMNASATVNTLYDIRNDPSSAYWNLHTTVNPGGEIRAQLRSTETVPFTTKMLPSNEVPAVTGLEASADSNFTLQLMRRGDGTAMSAYAVFDTNFRFPGETTFTGMHIHQGPAGVNGGVTLDSGIRAGSTVMSMTGSGSIYRAAIMATPAQVDALNAVLTNPANNYINLHSTVHPGGAVRAQLTAVNDSLPTVSNVITSVSDPALTTTAMGGLMTIYGQNLAKLAGNLDGWQGPRAPMSLNGTSVDVEGKAAAVVQVAPGFVIAQVPFEAKLGDNQLMVTSGNGAGGSFRFSVARIFPALFFDEISADGYRAVAFDLVNNVQIGKNNPASSSMLIGVYGTGFGQSAPALATAELPVGRPFEIFPGLKVTVGGRPATNVVGYLLPTLLGLTQVVFTPPAGLSGAQALEIDMGGVKSNRTIIYMR